MSKILLFTREAPSFHGGVGRYVAAIVQTFPNDVDVVLLPCVGTLRTFLSVLRRAKDSRAFWVHHILPVGTAAYMVSIMRKKPYVIFLHGLDFDLASRTVFRRMLTRAILRRANHIVTNSHALAVEVKNFAHIQDPLVVYPCIDDDIAARATEGKMFRSGQIAFPNIRLLTVGRLVPRKGHLKVLFAMQTLPNVEYTIVGDGPMRDTILRQAGALGIAERVHLKTDVNDAELVDAYRSADIFVMPSTKSLHDREGFGIAYIEAQAFGLPVVAVRQPGVDEAVEDGVSGILIDDTPPALLAALTALTRDADRRNSMGKAGKARVLSTFTRAKQFGKLGAFL